MTIAYDYDRVGADGDSGAHIRVDVVNYDLVARFRKGYCS